ncbi:hypothetical protein [Microbacterium amylolyticum]|uniref:Uncharacterized protein n=1 Tax=Microbacterium amylolyticum TaxID=936337 RepID=A0ABS4ZHQ2_9MICO|nr:hypothetical protein [Microbacterium amylolyticum]MBP2436805.1 hypothetical protein [Microbacterium amylolyticum]
MAVLVLSACASAEVPPGIAVLETSGAEVGVGHAASLDGTLVRENGCVYVVDDFQEKWIPLFSAGAVSERDGMIIYGAMRLTFGEDVSLPGGESIGGVEDALIPDVCDADTEQWVLPAQ